MLRIPVPSFYSGIWFDLATAIAFLIAVAICMLYAKAMSNKQWHERESAKRAHYFDIERLKEKQLMSEE